MWHLQLTSEQAFAKSANSVRKLNRVEVQRLPVPAGSALSCRRKMHSSLVMKNAGCRLVFLTRSLHPPSDAAEDLKRREKALVVNRVKRERRGGGAVRLKTATAQTTPGRRV